MPGVVYDVVAYDESLMLSQKQEFRESAKPTMELPSYERVTPVLIMSHCTRTAARLVAMVYPVEKQSL